MNSELDSVELIPASDDDYEFSFQVKKLALGKLITRVFGWNEDFERDYHLKQWLQKRPFIIQLDGTPIGTMSVVEIEGDMEISQFFILPEYQNKGTGSRLLQMVLRRADMIKKTVKLSVLKGNRVKDLYRRHGFELVGHDDKFYYMERKPQ